MGFYGEFQGGEIDFNGNLTPRELRIRQQIEQEMRNEIELNRKDLYKKLSKDCETVNTEDPLQFRREVRAWLTQGYKLVASSCNSKEWKAILVLGGE